MCLLQLSHSTPSAIAFDSFSYRIRLLRSLHSTPSAIAFVSSGHCIRLLQLSHSTPSVIAFDSFGHCIRLLQLSHSTPSAIAFVSFGHCIRLLQPSHSSPSATAFDSFSHRSRMCQLNEVDELVKWSGWVRIMKFMISAQLPIHANGKAKRSLFLLFPILLPTSVKFLAKSGYFSLFNSEIEWNIRENL